MKNKINIHLDAHSYTQEYEVDQTSLCHVVNFKYTGWQ